MTALPLRYEFEVATPTGLMALGHAFGKVARAFYEENRQLFPHPDDVGVVAVNGGVAVDKTTFCRAALEAMASGHPYETDECSFPIPKTRLRQQAWRSVTLPMDGTQHRVFDSGLCGPYFRGDKSISPEGIRDVPGREFPGIDLVEHAADIPVGIIIGKVKITSRARARLHVEMALPAAPGPALAEFAEEAQRLTL